MVVRKQVKSKIKYRISQKFVFKTKRTYRVLDKSTPNSYLLQHLNFCKGLGRSGRKAKESLKILENIPPTVVLFKKVYREDTIFSTM